MEIESSWIDQWWSSTTATQQLPTTVHTDWVDIISVPATPVFSPKFVIKGKRGGANSEFPGSSTGNPRKRRFRETLGMVLSSTVTIGATSVKIEQATCTKDACQKVVNALSGILPLDVKMNIFGFWHSVILVAVFYRHSNLCWVLLNRVNHKLYLSSHFVADSLHLFMAVRKNLKLTLNHQMKKWTRQGVSDIMCFFKNIESMKSNNSVKLNKLPSNVLRFKYTKTALNEVNEFLRGVGPGGYILRTFTRKQPLPHGFNPITGDLTDSTRGWKVFKSTFGPKCSAKQKKNCECVNLSTKLESANISQVPANEAMLLLMTVLPSSLDKPMCNILRNHFQKFIEYVKNNPRRIFFPIQDAEQ
jgi:hypothetical protein